MRTLTTVIGALALLTLTTAITRAEDGSRRGSSGSTGSTATTASTTSRYVVIGWNDLGMHCISPRFKEMAILPPYNNLMAVVIRRGEEPSVMTSGISVSYALVNNATVTGKTDFWTYAQALFGKQLPLGIGLTGLGLSGSMKPVNGHFEAVGIPALPYTDNNIWNPYQQATLTVKNSTGSILGTTTVVVPISDEMNCAKRHSTGGPAAANISTPTVEGNILTLHDQKEGTHLMNSRPVLCASCHSDNALGTPGNPGVPSMSMSMHTKHSQISVAITCYNCHPGANTQCNRSAISAMGPAGTDPQCEKCHGNLQQMAVALKAGRKPWLQEPTCAQCHGATYSTGTTLYRNARGHGGLLCATCHNSPHAWWPSQNVVDNSQPLRLQNSSKAIGYNACYVCHTDGRTGTMPPHHDD